MDNLAQQNSENIQVLEIRNYLLKPNLTDKFSDYFHSKFVVPMNELGGYTVGEFKINGVNDRFVWFRAFADMKTRLKFLNDFYINSATWKEYGKGANEMMINSDNVYLLRPLKAQINREFLKTDKTFTVVDFYVCNSTLEKVINLFDTTYIPFLKNLKIEDITLWVSEMTENDFPGLPVFRDKNLLVSITNYKNENEFNTKQKEIDNMPADLKKSMQELVTIHNKLVLLNLR
ncbi:NIPSNAP protein [Flavobacterium chryseum]|uniref:NIPSNAP family protein n=1 Tax=Flavobacterium sp. P3160 TaxID=2512113 RepID=UPI00105E3918|nr:NIPSNAP family protein [Flavobacterium sp. P3160]TDO70033.1 NIPSNAP protein [Flavobacterium sp. P3160]